jgi:hypothetical protein
LQCGQKCLNCNRIPEQKGTAGGGFREYPQPPPGKIDFEIYMLFFEKEINKIRQAPLWREACLSLA